MESTTNFHMNEGQPSSEEHLKRDPELCENEKHIDLHNKYGDSYHTVLYDKPILDVYNDLFGNALTEYNKGKKPCRQMTMEEYMQSVADDNRGKKQSKTVNGKKVYKDNPEREGKQIKYEFTVSVGNTNRKTKKSSKGYNLTQYTSDGHHIREEYFPRDLQVRILDRYYDSFPERNPTLALASVDRHADEGFINRKKQWEYGVIHDHYQYVPVGDGYQRGLSVQNSMNKALSALGCKSYEDFTKREKKYLEIITYYEYKNYCKEHPDFYKEHGDLHLYRPVSEGKRKGDKTKEQFYQEREMEELLEDARQQNAEQKDAIEQLQNERVALQNERDNLSEKNKQLSTVISNVYQEGEEFGSYRKRKRELEIEYQKKLDEVDDVKKNLISELEDTKKMNARLLQWYELHSEELDDDDGKNRRNKVKAMKRQPNIEKRLNELNSEFSDEVINGISNDISHSDNSL